MACEKHGTTNSVFCKYCDAEALEEEEFWSNELANKAKGALETLHRSSGLTRLFGGPKTF